jgi:hypothetical protein
MAVVVLIVALRHRLAELFEQLPKRVKAGPLELEWDRAVAETATELAAPREAISAFGADIDDLADLVPLADTHPGAAVLEAAARIERALAGRFESTGADVPPRRGMRDLARRAVGQGLISDETARAIDGLMILRNLAAHGQEDVTPERAREFLALAEAVLYQLGAPAK